MFSVPLIIVIPVVAIFSLDRGWYCVILLPKNVKCVRVVRRSTDARWQKIRSNIYMNVNREIYSFMERK